jgi:hypothetical protein
MKSDIFFKFSAVAILIIFIFFVSSVVSGAPFKSIDVNVQVTEESSTCNGNGICEPASGEDGITCATDCGCNNNEICEPNRGENSSTCWNDCEGGGPGSHTECNAQLQCISVSGDGVNKCLTNNDCKLCDTHGDLNKDGKINIVDFSILMYFWNQTNPSNPCADINKDGIVNLTDFSIMLYWWTG